MQTVTASDGTGGPGNPHFTIAINGAHTAEVERTINGTFTVPVYASQLSAGQGQLRIRVQIVDEDIAIKTVRAEYPPANPPV